MADSIVFSVIIPTFNRKHSLLECLRSLARQTYSKEKFEVIVVDDGSTDGTPAALMDFKNESSMQLVLPAQDHSGPCAARNFAAEAARGEILAFTDDDLSVEPQWLEHAADHLADPSVTGIEGATILAGSLSSIRLLDAKGHVGFMTCNLFLRKKVFVGAGGFDTAYFDKRRSLYFREDADLGFRLLKQGCVIQYVVDVVAVHVPIFQSIGSIFKHARRYYFDALLYRNHPLLYRRLIELKSLGPIRIHRPFHYLCMANIFSMVLMIILGVEKMSLAFCSSGLLYAVSLLAIAIRYERKTLLSLRGVMHILVFVTLPVYYWYWLLRGCFRFRRFGLIV